MIIEYKDVLVDIGDEMESVMISNSIFALCPIAQVLLHDVNRAVSEGLRVLGDEIVNIIVVDNSVPVKIPFRLASGTIAPDGINKIAKLGLVHEYGYKMLLNPMSSGYSSTSISRIILNELNAIGERGADVATVLTEVTVTPTGLNLGQELLRIMEFEPDIAFLWHDMTDKAHFSTWEKLRKIAPVKTLSETAEPDSTKILDWFLEIPNLWLRSGGEKIDTWYAEMPTGSALTTEQISYDSGHGIGEKTAWFNAFVTKKFIGAGTQQAAQFNKAKANFMRTVHSSLQLTALVGGSFGWRPGQKVMVAGVGVTDLYDVNTFGEWFVYAVEHTFTAQDWKTTLRMTRTGAENISDGRGFQDV